MSPSLWYSVQFCFPKLSHSGKLFGLNARFRSLIFVALNQQTSIMYHDMGYPSHAYPNYLTQFNSNAYGDPVHYMQHLSTAVPVSTPPPSPLLPPLSYTNDLMQHHHHHHQHRSMMPHENRIWYQPPIAIMPQLDHRYSWNPLSLSTVTNSNINKLFQSQLNHFHIIYMYRIRTHYLWPSTIGW